VEVTVTISDALDNLNGVIAAFGEAVGIGAIEGVQDVVLPVLKHGETCIKFGDIGNMGEGTESFEALAGFSAVGRSHKLIEFLFEKISLPKIPVKEKHPFYSRFALRLEVLHMRQKEFSAAFEILSLFGQQFLLNTLTNVFKCPCTVANNMETVNNNGSVWEERFGQSSIFLLHICNKVANIRAVRKSSQISVNFLLLESRQNIQYPFFQGISKDALKLAIFGIAPELINGKNFG